MPWFVVVGATAPGVTILSATKRSILPALLDFPLSLRKLISYLNDLCKGQCMKTALGPGTATIGLMLDDLLMFTSLGGAQGHLLLGILLSPAACGKMFSCPLLWIHKLC